MPSFCPCLPTSQVTEHKGLAPNTTSPDAGQGCSEGRGGQLRSCKPKMMQPRGVCGYLQAEPALSLGTLASLHCHCSSESLAWVSVPLPVGTVEPLGSEASDVTTPQPGPVLPHVWVKFRSASSCWAFSPRNHALLVYFVHCQMVRVSPMRWIPTWSFRFFFQFYLEYSQILSCA